MILSSGIRISLLGFLKNCKTSIKAREDKISEINKIFGKKAKIK